MRQNIKCDCVYKKGAQLLCKERKSWVWLRKKMAGEEEIP